MMTDSKANINVNDDVSAISSDDSVDNNNPLPTVLQSTWKLTTNTNIPVMNTSTEANDNSSTDIEVVIDRSLGGKHGEALIPPEPRAKSNITRQEWKADVTECPQNNSVWCQKCRKKVKRKYFAMAGREGQGCNWLIKCPLCQQYCNNKLVDSQLCHKVVNGKVVVTN
jgi:hypothetical protein